MGKIYVDVPDELAKIFRIVAIQKFGSIKGSLSMAAEEAIAEWVRSEGKKNSIKLRLKEFQK